jgi:thiamine pyrophosphate-dependent acetolactate synthase large subunit-like protein
VLARLEVDDQGGFLDFAGWAVTKEKPAELMGCHGEHVERPEEFRPALERALRAGKTALVNVVGDRTIGHPSLGGNLLGSTRV